MKSYQLIIGYTTEGPTDVKFLKDVILRTFVALSNECKRSIEILDVMYINKTKGLNFVDEILSASKKAYASGIHILCIHCDADCPNDHERFKNKILPAISAIKEYNQDQEVCKCLVPIVPIYMTEAWMLADKELLKEEIGTNKTDSQLNINIAPEICSNPKERISNAIRIARQELTQRRRRDLTISDLYVSMGEGINLALLDKLQSYKKFKEEIRNAFKELNLLPLIKYKMINLLFLIVILIVNIRPLSSVNSADEILGRNRR